MTEAPSPPETASSLEPPAAPVDRALDAALRLALDRPWGEISLREIAEEAGLRFADLYAEVDGKDALLARLSRRFDLAALASEAAAGEAQAHDRLFEAVMARVEAMEPHRTVLIALSRQKEVAAAVALRLPRTARALLEAAGIDTAGPRGMLRVAGLTGVWARVLQVWRDDEGALNRTMAEIDKALRTLNRRLTRVGAGF